GQKREELYEGNTGTSAFDLEIDMSTYSQGVYILRIIGNGAVKTFKLMRE
ncbi:MAG: T9SS type A sorting domain-containing protein, partial [Bacteroidales bacterium]|nr:T9SS type A sorting domain-containing protein [Bacteroidales bacterium]